MSVVKHRLKLSSISSLPFHRKCQPQVCIAEEGNAGIFTVYVIKSHTHTPTHAYTYTHARAHTHTHDTHTHTLYVCMYTIRSGQNTPGSTARGWMIPITLRGRLGCDVPSTRRRTFRRGRKRVKSTVTSHSGSTY